MLYRDLDENAKGVEQEVSAEEGLNKTLISVDVQHAGAFDDTVAELAVSMPAEKASEQRHLRAFPNQIKLLYDKEMIRRMRMLTVLRAQEAKKKHDAKLLKIQ